MLLKQYNSQSNVMNDLSCWESKFEWCYYSKRLLTKLSRINETARSKINFLEVKKAIYYAKKYHGNQKRESGEPYYSHPLEVAYKVADYCFKTDILVTSILHDTIEDTEFTKKNINYIFGMNVADQVYDLTRIKLDRKISVAEMIELLWHKKEKDLLLIKYFDRLHNMQTIQAKSPERAYKIVEETLKQFLSLGLFLNSKFPKIFLIEEQIIQLCYKNTILKQQSLDLESFLDNSFQLSYPNVQSDLYLNNTLRIPET